MLFPIETDLLFANSPDAGHPDCICSRCGEPIGEEVIPIRVFTDDNREYRYHPDCVGLAVDDLYWDDGSELDDEEWI